MGDPTRRTMPARGHWCWYWYWYWCWWRRGGCRGGRNCLCRSRYWLDWWRQVFRLRLQGIARFGVNLLSEIKNTVVFFLVTGSAKRDQIALLVGPKI